jgi:hypothetical protein
MSRKDFLVGYDYGQGGLWAIVRAETAEQIRARYPQVAVYSEPPTTLDAATLTTVRSTPAVDVDDPPTGWLADLEA